MSSLRNEHNSECSGISGSRELDSSIKNYFPGPLLAALKSAYIALYNFFSARGNFRALLVMERMLSFVGSRATNVVHLQSRERARRRLSAKNKLMRRGFRFPPRRSSASYTPNDRLRFYLVHFSLPLLSSGYAIRTHGLVKALIDQGQEVLPISRLGYPHDLNRYDTSALCDRETVDGVTYARLIDREKSFFKTPLDEYLGHYADRVIGLAHKLKPKVIHAASNYANGIAAVQAGRQLGIPSIYEVRGLWEITRSSRDPSWGRSDEYKLISRLERCALREADLVLCLNGALRDYVIAEHNVDPARCKILPNAVDVSRFHTERNGGSGRNARQDGEFVVTYIGSVLDYEGCDDLVRAASLLKQRRVRNISFVVVGDGPYLPLCRQLAARLGVEDIVEFTGRVPFNDVAQHYADADIIVLPRKPLPVTELVTPLKIFEALAAGRPVLCSSVQALKNVVEESEAGLIYEKGSVESLANRLMETVGRSDLSAIGSKGREYVIRQRTWSNVAKTLGNIYESF